MSVFGCLLENKVQEIGTIEPPNFQETRLSVEVIFMPVAPSSRSRLLGILQNDNEKISVDKVRVTHRET
jgi:hypothetical protein